MVTIDETSMVAPSTNGGQAHASEIASPTSSGRPGESPLVRPPDLTSEPTVRQILGITDAAMDQAMAIAYQLYVLGRYAEADIICRGLIACDQRYWWTHSLHASVLRRLGRTEDALAAVTEGLKHEPGQPKLALMRAELTTTLSRQGAARAEPGAVGSSANESRCATRTAPPPEVQAATAAAP